MIVDIHTHPPQHRNLPPGIEPEYNDKWRPDRAVKVTTCWDDYMEGQKPAARSVVFGIAVNPSGAPREGDPDWSEGNINDAVTAFVAAYPDRLIGFCAVHPFDPNCMDELERCRADPKRGTSPIREAPIRYAHPLLVDEIAMRYPDLRVVMAHLGHPWQVDTCVVIRKHPNVYADLSANFYRPFSFWSSW